MKVTVEKLPTSEAVLNVDLTWEELEKASDKAYRKLVQKVDIQGFRRGKAPRSMVERKLGKESIYQEALDDLINEIYRDTVKEHDLNPLASPELDAPLLEMDQEYHFSIKVPVLTPVELGDYHELHFEREEADVTSEEVEQELEAQRNQRATWETVERPAAVGDRVTVDLKLTVGDQTVSDLKDNPFELTDERHGLFTGMDEQVIGMQASESKSFTTTIPADYTNEKIAGQEANYDVLLHKVEIKHLPELDDAFATEISSYESLEDLRKALSDSILDRKQRQNRDALRDQVMNALIEQSQITLHPLLVKEEAEEMLHQFTHVLEQQHMSLDQYLMLMRKSRDEYLKELEPEAEQRVKRELVLDEVAKQEGIEVTPEELENLFRLYSQAGQNLPQTEAQIRALFVSYRREKAMNLLVEAAAGPEPTDELAVVEGAEAQIENAQASELDSPDSEEQSVVNARAAALAAESLHIEETAPDNVVESQGSATMDKEGTSADTVGQ